MQLLLFLHERLSFASLSAVPHVSSMFFKSPSKVFTQGHFSLPCFLFPRGFHLKLFLGILFYSILGTCSSHLCLLCLTSVAILWLSVLAYSSSFEILFSQYISQIRLKHLLIWKLMSIIKLILLIFIIFRSFFVFQCAFIQLFGLMRWPVINDYIFEGLNVTISGWGKNSYDADLHGRNYVSKLQAAT